MKVIVLAGGFGTRLQRDIENSQGYKHLFGIPKPLLSVAGKPVISHWMDTIRGCLETSTEVVYVTVNEANCSLFEEWRVDHQSVELLSSGARTDRERRGAVADIVAAVQHFVIRDDVLIVGGDTLFYEDFSLSDFITAFYNSPALPGGGGFVTYYTCHENDVNKRGILELDKSGQVISFIEKLKISETKSRKACPCLYILSQNSLTLLADFLEKKKDAPFIEKDATGTFVAYLSARKPVFSYKVCNRYDIGSLDSYLYCQSFYRTCPHTDKAGSSMNLAP